MRCTRAPCSSTSNSGVSCPSCSVTTTGWKPSLANSCASSAHSRSWPPSIGKYLGVTISATRPVVSRLSATRGRLALRLDRPVPLRILHAVEFYAPSVGGAQEVVRQVSRRLAARGHDVTVATSPMPERRDDVIDGVRVREFDVRGNEVRGMEGDVEGYRRFIANGDFDVVMTYAAQQWTTDALLPALDSIRAPKVLAPCGFSGLRDPAYTPYFEHLRDDLRAFDALVFHSDTYQDVRFAREAGADGITVIPNAADEGEFGELRAGGSFRAAHKIGPDAPLLLTVGSHTGAKGHAPAMAALRASRHRPQPTLAIVGNTPFGRGCLPSCRARAAFTRATGRGRVVLADAPRDQVLDAYADADLFVFCSMVECSPLALFEAMAAGLPFVSVDVGNAAEIAEWSGAGVIVPSRRREDGLVVADSRGVADAVDQLLADHDRRREMGERGRRVWKERFTWEATTPLYEELYERLAR
jgi:glycosyltransferase involved in cell wall biosynthesis